MGQWPSESFFVSILDVWRYLNYDENPSTVRSDASPLFRLLNCVYRFARALRGRGNFETCINSMFPRMRTQMLNSSISGKVVTHR